MTTDEAVELAKLVLAGKARSYVGAAYDLAKFVRESEKPTLFGWLQAWADRYWHEAVVVRSVTIVVEQVSSGDPITVTVEAPKE